MIFHDYFLHKQTGVALLSEPDPAVQSCLVDQPSADILDLAAVAPGLFEPPELRTLLRDALRDQAAAGTGLLKPRSM